MGHWHGYWTLKENITKQEWKLDKVREQSPDGKKYLVNKLVQPYLKGDKEKPDEKNYIVK